ncbi:MAG: SLATT domain-containing protein, partial [Anaerolineales bacterium]
MEERRSPILELAWTRYAHFDAASLARTRAHLNLRRWIAILGVAATLFAILVQLYPPNFPAVLGLVLRIFLIAIPLASAGLAAFANKFFGSGDWLVLRAGAEEILKEIFIYRTIMKNQPNRRAWLEKRLAEIQRTIYRGLGGEMILKPYTGPIPPYDDPDDPYDDGGFSDLTGDEYFTYRVESQLAWHMNKVNKIQKERVRLQVLIILAGIAGAFLAAWGAPFSLWVALTASTATALIGWQELRNLDSTLKNYSKVVVELMVIYDHWHNLEPEERTEAEFIRMVRSTEDLLWSQNVEYIKSMQEALASTQLEEAKLLDELLQRAVQSDRALKQSMRDSLVDFTSASMEESRESLGETFKETLGTLAEEASSELVQKELSAMQAAA